MLSSKGLPLDHTFDKTTAEFKQWLQQYPRRRNILSSKRKAGGSWSSSILLPYSLICTGWQTSLMIKTRLFLVKSRLVCWVLILGVHIFSFICYCYIEMLASSMINFLHIEEKAFSFNLQPFLADWFAILFPSLFGNRYSSIER